MKKNHKESPQIISLYHSKLSIFSIQSLMLQLLNRRPLLLALIHSRLYQLLHNLIVVPVLAVLRLLLVICILLPLQEPQSHVVRVDLARGCAQSCVPVLPCPLVENWGYEVLYVLVCVLFVGLGFCGLVQVVLNGVSDYHQEEINLFQLLQREHQALLHILHVALVMKGFDFSKKLLIDPSASFGLTLIAHLTQHLLDILR